MFSGGCIKAGTQASFGAVAGKAKPTVTGHGGFQ